MVGGDVLEEQRSQGMGSAPTNHAQYYFSESEKKKFRDDPDFHLQYRKRMEAAVNSLFEVFLKDSDTSRAVEKMMRAEMHRRIGGGHEELKDKLIPHWPVGCRRLTPGDGYLEALVQPSKPILQNHNAELTSQMLQRAIERSPKLYQKALSTTTAHSTNSTF